MKIRRDQHTRLKTRPPVGMLGSGAEPTPATMQREITQTVDTMLMKGLNIDHSHTLLECIVSAQLEP